MTGALATAALLFAATMLAAGVVMCIGFAAVLNRDDDPGSDRASAGLSLLALVEVLALAGIVAELTGAG